MARNTECFPMNASPHFEESARVLHGHIGQWTKAHRKSTMPQARLQSPSGENNPPKTARNLASKLTIRRVLRRVEDVEMVRGKTKDDVGNIRQRANLTKTIWTAKY